MRWILAETFATKAVVQKGLGYEVEYRPVNPNEMAIRAMLTKEPRDGGLIGRLPRLEIEQPQAPVMPPEPEPSFLPDDHPEVIASRRAAARYSNQNERTALESARGAEKSAEFARRQAAAAAGEKFGETQVAEPQIVESYPVFAPPQETPPPAESRE
jgi:hypothetical protein